MTKTFEEFLKINDDFSKELTFIRKMAKDIRYQDFAPTQFSYDAINDSVYYEDQELDILDQKDKDWLEKQILSDYHELSNKVKDDEDEQ